MSDFDFSKMVSNGYGVSQIENVGRDWYVTINFTDFWGAKFAVLENEVGDDEEFICIPIKRNGFTKTDNLVVYGTMFGMRYSGNNRKGTHSLIPVLVPAIIQARKKLGYKTLTVGRMRPCNFKVRKYKKN